MRAMLVGLLVILAAACGPRQVEVRTGEPEQSQVSLHVTNNLNQPVLVYVQYSCSEVFLGQVNGGSGQQLNVPGVPSGAQVVIRGRTQDGQSTYCANSCNPVTLSGVYSWRVP